MSLSDVPSKAAALRVREPEAQRALDLLKAPLDASLRFLNGVFSGSATSPSLTLAALNVTGAVTAGSVAADSIVGDLSGSTGLRVPLLTVTQQAAAIPAALTDDFPYNAAQQVYLPFDGTVTHITARMTKSLLSGGQIQFFTHLRQGGVDTFDSTTVTLTTATEYVSAALATPMAFTAASGGSISARFTTSVGYAAPANAYITVTLWGVV